MNKLRKIVLFFVFAFLLTLTQQIEAQNYSKRDVGASTKHKKYLDSVSKVKYPYRFPILGEKVRKLGFDIPLPNGIMVNYTYGSEDVIISNLAIGVHPDELIDISEYAFFSSIKPSQNVVDVRYDVWVLPFLNFSILGGYVDSSTEVSLALPFEANFISKNSGPMVGWGFVAAAGFGPIFGTIDYNMAWTFMPRMDKPSLTKLFDIRVGHTVDFNQKRDMNLSFFIGAQNLKLSSSTIGYTNLDDLLGIDKPEMAEKLDNWYNGLTPEEQEKLGPIYNKIDDWLNGGEDDLYYSFNKKLYHTWAMTLGLNYQINRRWMIEVIYTFLGSREQLTTGFNYRFGFKGKTILSGVTF
jgi:hypothetical protein